MKLLNTTLSFAICLLCFGCQQSEIASSGNASPLPNNETTVEIEDKASDVLIPIKEIAKVDTSRFSSVTIKRTDKRKKYTLNINIEYPQLINPKTSFETKFNRFVRTHVNERISSFSEFLDFKEKDSKERVVGEYELNLYYKVNFFSDAFTSVIMYWDGFSGYLNQDYFPATINYDLKMGKELSLEDIFTPESNYLSVLSDKSRRILKATCLECGCDNGINAGDRLPQELIEENEVEIARLSSNRSVMAGYLLVERGTEPEKENFANWSITAEGIKITFAEYQIGPGCIGIISIVIPFDEIRTSLNTEFEFIK